MALHLRKNQYRGVNAHLQSFFQNHGGWPSFHGRYIIYLSDMISDRLPPGYLVDAEQSLQIREFHPDTGERIRRPEPDVGIYELNPQVSTKVSSTSSDTVATLTQPIIETLEFNEDLYYLALMVYEVVADAVLGRPIMRIEVLSPSNKPGGDGYSLYQEKRYMTLKSGLRLVEIDFLHETRSPVKGLPRYPRQPDSHPYRITVSDPTPTFETGLAKTSGFDVDQPIPMIALPLSSENSIEIDFGAVYNRVFESLEAYSVRVDYEQLPDRFEAYSPADQERIRQVMTRAKSENPH
jgi:Protein of unknown function (DUF4058)